MNSGTVNPRSDRLVPVADHRWRVVARHPVASCSFLSGFWRLRSCIAAPKSATSPKKRCVSRCHVPPCVTSSWLDRPTKTLSRNDEMDG